MQRIGYTLFSSLILACFASCGPAQEAPATGPAGQTGTTTESSAAETPSDVSPIPEGWFTLTPTLVVDDVAAAVDYYANAFGAERGLVMKTPDGSMILHAEVKLGDSMVMITPEMPAAGAKSPKTLGGSPGSLTYYVEDVDAVVAKAVAAGAKAVMPVADMFWGDRYGMVVDPFGHHWGIATHKEDIGEAAMAKRAEVFMQAQMSGKAAEVKYEPGTPAKSYKPEGYHTLTPGFVVKDASAMIEFYKEALGAEERSRMAMPDGRLMHAEVKIGDSILMLSDEMPEHGQKAPITLGGTPFWLMVYVEDVDATFADATQAGAKVEMPVADMFWGDRYGSVLDASGHRWGIATHKEDLTPEQLMERMKKAMGGEKPGEAGPKPDGQQ